MNNEIRRLPPSKGIYSSHPTINQDSSHQDVQWRDVLLSPPRRARRVSPNRQTDERHRSSQARISTVTRVYRLDPPLGKLGKIHHMHARQINSTQYKSCVQLGTIRL